MSNPYSREWWTERLPFVQAIADGKRIEVRDGHGRWMPSMPADSPPTLVLDISHYRIAPEPKLRPWKPEEVPVGALTRMKPEVNASNPSRQIITGENGVMCFVCGAPWRMDSMLEQREWSTDGGNTWHPCGVLESQV